MGDYKTELLHREDYRTTEWSGGTTTELSIAPEGSVYADRDFLWRLSSATVDVEESTFTSLPDYNRIIMTLRGGIRLSHNGGGWIELPAFTPHAFDGGDETVSVGKVVDFNLMLRKGRCDGEAEPFLAKAGEQRELGGILKRRAQEYEVVMLYCFEGELTVTLETGESFRMEDGDTLKLSGNFEGISWRCEAGKDTSAVLAAVRACGK